MVRFSPAINSFLLAPSWSWWVVVDGDVILKRPPRRRSQRGSEAVRWRCV